MLLKGTILLLAVACQLATVSAANDKAKRLINFLWGNTGKKILSGAFGGYINVRDENGLSWNHANQIQAKTGKLPAIYAIDCAQGWAMTAPGKETDLIQCVNQVAVDYANKGGIIAVNLHLPNPLYKGNNWGDRYEGGLRHRLSNDQYNQLTIQGTEARDRWYRMLNKIADGLAFYQAKGITVLFRPLHEMNGEWFWWGNTGYNSNDQTRFDLYKKLWIDMHNFFTNYRGLHNLLWVYSPDVKRDHKSAFYPGDKYVDIIGLDAYLDNFDDDRMIKGYKEMIGLRKPFGLAEVGPDQQKGSFDYGRMMDSIVRNYPKTTFFVPWNSEWSPINNRNAGGAYKNGRVMNLYEFRI